MVEPGLDDVFAQVQALGGVGVTTAELEARLSQDWKKDVTAYENVHAQILKMADMLSDGIIKQFPGKLT